MEDLKLTEEVYVVFDLETTGLYPNSGDSIIEIGAVKIKDGKIIDRYDELINPGKLLSDEIIKITGINNEMLKDKKTIEEELPRIVEFLSDCVLVAHNASFDVNFLNDALVRVGKKPLDNPVIDTLDLSYSIYFLIFFII